MCHFLSIAAVHILILKSEWQFTDSVKTTFIFKKNTKKHLYWTIKIPGSCNLKTLKSNFEERETIKHSWAQ